MKKVDIKDFIYFWKKYYNEEGRYPDKYFYTPFINKELTKESLKMLWQWKMQDKYNRFPQRRVEVQKMCDDFKYLNDLKKQKLTKNNFNKLLKYSSRIFQGGNVYRIFLFHIIWPEDFSILDQHVIRSFLFFKNSNIVKDTPCLIGKDSIQFNNDCLYNQYNDFVKSVSKKNKLSLRDIDKALMAFGEFLDNPKLFVKNKNSKN